MCSNLRQCNTRWVSPLTPLLQSSHILFYVSMLLHLPASISRSRHPALDNRNRFLVFLTIDIIIILSHRSVLVDLYNYYNYIIILSYQLCSYSLFNKIYFQSTLYFCQIKLILPGGKLIDLINFLRFQLNFRAPVSLAAMKIIKKHFHHKS